MNDLPKNPWLVMLYLAGDNNLTEDMVLTLEDLRAEGPPAGDSIVAQFDPSAAGLLTQRYDFTKFTPGAPLDHYRTGTLAETDTGNKEALVSFIKYSVEKHGGPDKNYLLVLCGHGSGVTEDFFLRDEDSRDSLTINELQDALNQANQIIKATSGKNDKKIDILGLDACFMGMGEVAYQERNDVNILVSSEGLEPEFGWPYRRLLAAAKSHKSHGQSMDRAELARMIVKEYVDYYADYDRSAGRSADLAAVDLSMMEALATAVEGLATSLMDAKDQDSVTLAHFDAQTYKFDQFVDLHDFCIQAYKRIKRDDVREACAQVISVLDGGTQAIVEPVDRAYKPVQVEGRCIIRSGCSGYAHQHSYGVSIYFPWAIVSPDYQDLEFAKRTRWHLLLKQQVEATRRLPRFGAVRKPRLSPQCVDAVRKTRASQLKGLLALAEAVGSGIPGYRIDKLDGDLADKIGGGVDRAASKVVDRAASKVDEADIPEEDAVVEFDRRLIRQGGLGVLRSRYTGEGSRYTGEGSRYTGEGSRYTGEGSRFPGDRERSVKNLPPSIGKDFWPPSERT